QYLMQNLGLDSAYCSGISINDPEDINRDAVHHSFIVIKDGEEGSYIFDIARPHRIQGEPVVRVLRTPVAIEADTFSGQKNVLVAGRDVLSDQQILFGVGDSSVDQEQGESRRLVA